MPTRSHRRALTLLEIVLVLSLIVMICALAVPSLRGALSNQRLKKSADLVRASLSRARVEAMRSGQIQAFRFQVGGDRYATMPWSSAGDALGLGGADATVGDANAFLSATINSNDAERLPEGITFYSEPDVADERTQAMSADAEPIVPSVSDEDGQWSLPILFYPDGTASDAYLVLRNERGRTVGIELRGLTGISQVGELERSVEPNSPGLDGELR